MSRFVLAWSLTLAVAGACFAAGPEAPIRQLDAYAPFYDPELPPPRSWAMPFSHLDLVEAPYVREEALEGALERFERYCAQAEARGYTAVMLGNLIHWVGFEGLDPPVYDPEGPYAARHRIYRAAFGRAVEIAGEHGLKVVLDTDFPAWTPPLVEWLGEGGLSLDNPKLWEAYRAAVDEALGEMGVWALSVRIGEGGGAYDEAAGYSSSISVRTVEETQQAIRGLLELVDGLNARTDGDHRLMFRTWTIGIGEIGALHTDPELYTEVFAPFAESETLITVIKHVAMDFYRFIPRNPTIGTGTIPQVVEFQARREYELFGALPNYLGEWFAEDMRAFSQQESFAGISVWPTNGGFLWSAPTYYGSQGPDAWIDLNVYAFAQLARDASRTAREIARDWALERGLEQDDATLFAEVMLGTDDVIDQGFYLRGYAERTPGAFGVDYLPSLLWVYWDRPVAALGVQSLMTRYALDELPRAFADGREALDKLRGLRQAALRLRPSEIRDELLAALDYERSVLTVLGRYREHLLAHHAWALSGDADAYAAWRDAITPLSDALDAHEADFGDSRFYPALDLRELRREVRDARYIPGLRPWSGLLALLQLGLLVLIARARGLRWGRDACAIAAAGVFAAGTAVVAVSAYEGWDTFLVVFGLVAGPGALTLACCRVAHQPSDPTPAAETPSVALVMTPALSLGAAVAMILALRGPLPLYHALVDALLGGRFRWIVALFGLSLAVGLAICLWRVSRAAVGGRAAAAMGVRVAVVVLTLLVGGISARVVGVTGLLTINRVTRIGPTILGQAGTGVEDLIGEDAPPSR